MKVRVTAQISYSYEVEVNEPFTDEDIFYCDSADPVYQDICKIFRKEKIDQEAVIMSVVNNETGETVFDGTKWY